MSVETPRGVPWVVVKVAGRYYGVCSSYVREMVLKPHVNKIPDLPAHYLGVVNLRGQVIPVLSLRLFFGQQILGDEMGELLSKRKQDHLNWLKELAACVKERRKFLLTTDPHACAFGKWYDNYEPDNRIIANKIRALDTPHQRIHAIGEMVVSLVNEGRFDEAEEAVERVRDTDLATMVRLLDDLAKAFYDDVREIVLVVEADGHLTGLTVDGVVSAEHLRETQEVFPSALAVDATNIFQGVARREKENDLVMMLDVEMLLA